MTIAEFHIESGSRPAAQFSWFQRHTGAAALFGCLLFWAGVAVALYFAL
jgi:hypothetical protein